MIRVYREGYILLEKISAAVVTIGIIVFAVYWLWHFYRCLTRKDFRALDKLFWVFALLIPIIGIILYRGLGKEFYKRKPRTVIPKGFE
ncbi:MAG: hypothetical protein AB1546_07625 [bacterium]